MVFRLNWYIYTCYILGIGLSPRPKAQGTAWKKGGKIVESQGPEDLL